MQAYTLRAAAGFLFAALLVSSSHSFGNSGGVLGRTLEPGSDPGQNVFASTGPNATITMIALSAVSRYVDAVTGVNTGDCSVQANPCRTITYAMGQATAGNPGDLVSVAPGTYNLALGEVFPIIFKTGVQLVATGTPDNTIIDAAGDTVTDGIITSTGNNSPAARIEGFTIRNGLNIPDQGGVALVGALRISSSSAASSPRS